MFRARGGQVGPGTGIEAALPLARRRSRVVGRPGTVASTVGLGIRIRLYRSRIRMSRGFSCGPDGTVRSGSHLRIPGARPVDSTIRRSIADALRICGTIRVGARSRGTVIPRTRGHTVITRTRGHTIVTRTRGHTIITRVCGQTIITRVCGQTIITRVCGQTIVTRTRGHTIVTRTRGRTVITRVRGHTI
ncbi:hypothetical protein, partial [Nocardia pseudovaccinii]|uniref:hypothetical protein n=1 Tax=Nocardia pseudovaccinii TaxID=189540 RepID=UPI001C3FE7CA